VSGTVAGTLARFAAERPHDAFVKIGHQPWITYIALEESTDRIASGLAALGVGPGDRVALLCQNRLEAIELIFACAKLGAILVPLNYHLRGEFLRYQLADCGAETVVADAAGVVMCAGLLADTAVRRTLTLDDPVKGWVGFGIVRDCADAVERYPAAPSDLVSIIYTSGTTGLPKGCMLSNGYYINAALAVEPAGFIIASDRVFTAFPHYHVSLQLNTLMSALAIGASIVIEQEFHASTFMARAAAEQATMIWGLGTMATAILAQPPSPSDATNSLRLCVFAPLNAERQIAFADRFGCLVNSEAYGQTEAVPIALAQADRPSRVPFSEGLPGPLYEVRLVDPADNEVPRGEVGEIVVRPRRPNAIFSGYWGKPEATVASMRNLWHHTGDLAWLDEEGRIIFVDRAKDAIRRRGENVSCYQLEFVIGQHPDIAEVAATAVASHLGDDDIKISIVLREPRPTTAGEWFDYFKTALPYFAIPRYLEIRDALPHTATGRVRKESLRSEGVHNGVIDLEAMGLVMARSERRS
jgi:crotonobetaine/carnitine-CoA ligase